MPNPASPPNFDHIASLYRWAEYLTLGPLLQRTRTHHLPALAPCKRALILGDGDGRYTAALLTSNREILVHAVDTSVAMLQLLQRRVARARAAARLRITHADALDIALIPSPNPEPDLIVTHFFLDCLPQLEVEALITHLTPGLAPHAFWLVSDFRIPSGRLHWPARVYIRALYLAFRLLTGLRVTHLPDHATPLRAAGFTLLASHHRLFGILTSELWQRPQL